MPRFSLYISNGLVDGLKEVEKDVELEAIPRIGEDVWLKGHGDPITVSGVTHYPNWRGETVVVLDSVEPADLEEILAADPSWRPAINRC